MIVAVIEDDKSIINAVEVAFEFRWPDVKVISAMTGMDGVALVKNDSPDVVILDINLPDINGFEVLKKVRQFSNVPVIVLTVRADDNDVLRGLEAGADDYVTKPFNYLTLLARVKAVLRRKDKPGITFDNQTSIGSRLTIDFVNQKVRLDNAPIKLTPIEYQVLLILVKHINNVVSYKEIMAEIWNKDDATDTESIRIYVRRLRKKLGDIPPQLILNQHGSGYILKS